MNIFSYENVKESIENEVKAPFNVELRTPIPFDIPMKSPKKTVPPPDPGI